MPLYLLWPATIILSLTFAVCLLFLMPRDRRKRLKICGLLLGLSVGGGLFFYSFSYISTGAGLADTLFAALRSIFSTARMFIIGDDYGALIQVTENLLWQILFWFCHVLALITIQAALISSFGWQTVDFFRLRFGLHREVYIIKGSDNYALMLGENISTHDDTRKPDRNRLIVFLLNENGDMKKTHEKVAHFGGVVKMPDKKNGLKHYLKESGLGKRRGKKYYIVLTPNEASVADDAFIAAEYAKANARHINNIPNIFAFVSSEWDREQIEYLAQKKDKYPCIFHIISETDLLIRQMLAKYPPYKCPGLNFDKTGAAERSFNVMILGFGTIGQQALLRLIMNGQFVTRDKSRMRAIVADREIEHLEEHFRHCYPALEELCCEIEFLNYDVRDENFFRLLNHDKSRDTDYIIVALDGNEENKQVALDIRLNYTRRNLPLPFIAVSEKNAGFHESKQDDRLFTFGCLEEIYKDSVIIREEANRMAKAVNETYKNMYGGQSWHELDWFTQESNRASADFIPAMLYLAGEITEEEAVKAGKLTGDVDHTEILAQTEHLRWNAFHAAMGYRRSFDMTRRKDPAAKLHICLAPWDELDEISKKYNETTGENRDFKQNDRDVIENIPGFLKEAKEKRKGIKYI